MTKFSPHHPGKVNHLQQKYHNGEEIYQKAAEPYITMPEYKTESQFWHNIGLEP